MQQQKEYYKYIAVILVYRNTDDLIECINSFHETINDCKIIVVNSYYDEESENEIKTVADEENCIFLNVENKGYSFGNNRGIEYAREHFDYNYIIVSNPDIIINIFDEVAIEANQEYGILAPKIVARTGRLQNPMLVVRSRLSEALEYYGLKHNNKWLIMAGIAIGKIIRTAVVKIKRTSPYTIYAAHGSFVIMTKDTVDQLYPIYDENLFLFAEEGVLAYRASEAGIKTGQFDQIVINHKEDGSMQLSKLSINDELRKANIYYYEHYVLGR